MRTATLLLISALCAMAAGCAEELPTRDGVAHLDLRLADGRSPARALTAGHEIWVERLEIEGPQTDLGHWSTQYCRVDAPPPPGKGIALVGIVPDDTRIKRVELRSSATYEASEIDFVEIELARTISGIARVSWRSSLDGDLVGGFPRATTTIVPTTQDSVKLRIGLAAQPGWVGKIRELSIAPKEEGRQRFDVLAVRLGRIGFTPGDDPSGAELKDDMAASDGGLVAMGREQRRAFPSDWNVPLFARAFVPRGGKLRFDAGVSTNTNNLTAEIHFQVDARTDPAQPWTRVAATSIVPGMRAQGPAWEATCVPLSGFEGRDVELRFLAAESEAPREGGALDRARLYWGEPLIFGDVPAEPRPDVLLITLDTVRADALGVYRRDAKAGSASPTPFLDSLAGRGVLFEQAWTACNSTSPSHASILTGLAVQDHGVLDNRSLLAPENVTLAEHLRAKGWHTLAAVSVNHLAPPRSSLGQGFDRFWLGMEDSANDGALTIGAVKNWLRALRREGPRPTFLWVHLFDAHAPYDVPAWFLEEYCARRGVKVPPRRIEPPNLPANPWSQHGGFLSEVDNKAWADFMYEVCVAYADDLVRQLFAELQQQGALDRTVVAVVADHGESLGEHRNYYHHTSLYREVMAVPMLLSWPGGPRGLRVSEPVWTLDLARTLFDFGGSGVPAELRGTSLVDFVAQSPRPVRRLYFEHSDLHQVGCVDGEHSAIYTVVEYLQNGPERRIAPDTLEVYEAKDGAQSVDVGNTQPDVGARYRDLLRLWRESALDREHRRGVLSVEEESRLKQLGY